MWHEFLMHTVPPPGNILAFVFMYLNLSCKLLFGEKYLDVLEDFQDHDNSAYPGFD